MVYLVFCLPDYLLGNTIAAQNAGNPMFIPTLSSVASQQRLWGVFHYSVAALQWSCPLMPNTASDKLYFSDSW